MKNARLVARADGGWHVYVFADLYDPLPTSRGPQAA